jgi:membrane protein DedA with SNARE-associated domain
MNATAFSILTVITCAISAAALFMLPYSAGVFPNGMLEDSAVGPLPLWMICLALSLLLLAVAAETLLKLRRGSDRR